VKKLLVPAVLVFLAAVMFPVADAGAGLQTPHNIFLEKVLVGGGEPDQDFEILVTCVQADDTDEETEFISANEGGVAQLGNEAQTCTITEPDPQGAVASFECGETEGDAVCLADNVVQFTGSGVPDGDGDATVTITNTFGGVTPTSDSTTTTEASTSTTAGAGAAATAATRPSFTG
jgi:hypothetical protein